MTEVAAAVGGRLIGVDALASSVVTDSRVPCHEALFVALRGPRFDGHDYAQEASVRGAIGALVERCEAVPEGVPKVIVADTGAALMSLAAHVRRTLSARVIAITGSCGKTTTKDLTAAVVRSRSLAHAGPASFNNEVGVPMTILGADARTEVLVCEVGAGARGEIAGLCHVASPDVGVVTNVGVAHLQTFGSRRNIARAKAELVEALPSDGVAVLAADDPVVRGFDRLMAGRVVTFGESAGADVRAVDVEVAPDGRARFLLEIHGERRPRVTLRMPGRHMVQAALAAAACGVVMGVPALECARALGAADASPGRMETFESRGALVIDDSYNANPVSMAAALRTASHVAGGRPWAAVLGPMTELGRTAEREHERAGALAARLGAHVVLVVGADAAPIAGGARRAGLDPERIWLASDAAAAVAATQRALDAGVAVMLIKGSRAANLDHLAAALRRSP
jgi:UDP-N-acetylmuramoyl-tripeptide--D-alanyl-D-alanine ligase